MIGMLPNMFPNILILRNGYLIIHCIHNPPTALLTQSISAGSQISTCFEKAPGI